MELYRPTIAFLGLVRSLQVSKLLLPKLLRFFFRSQLPQNGRGGKVVFHRRSTCFVAQALPQFGPLLIAAVEFAKLVVLRELIHRR